jgi:hypothetical protein
MAQVMATRSSNAGDWQLLATGHWQVAGGRQPLATGNLYYWHFGVWSCDTLGFSTTHHLATTTMMRAHPPPPPPRAITTTTTTTAAFGRFVHQPLAAKGPPSGVGGV